MEKKRCFGNKPGQEIYALYHDEEWGKEIHDDRLLFEYLILEGAQAGLTWFTVLKKRDGYRQSFHQFDPQKVANMTDDELNQLQSNPNIIRNRLKIYSTKKNAIAFIEIQKEYGSFDQFLWSFVNHKQIVNHHKTFETVPVTSDISDQISKILKKRGMSFVGSTIIYAYMQAVGLVDDHLESCWVREENNL